MKQTSIRRLLLAAAVAAGATVAAASEPISQTRTVADFTGLSVGGKCRIIFTAGPCSLRLESEKQEAIDRVQTQVTDGTLRIESDGVMPANVTVYASAPRLAGLSISGACRFETDRPIETDDLKLKVNGAGRIETNGISCSSLTVDQNGSTVFKDKGRINCQRLRCDIDGAGKATLTDVESESAQVGISGAGLCNATTMHARSLELKLSGAGKMNIAGIEADDIEATISGMGKITLEGRTGAISTKVNGLGKIVTDNLTRRE